MLKKEAIMKKSCFLIVLLILFFSCPESNLKNGSKGSGNESNNNNEDEQEAVDTVPPTSPSNLTLNAASFCRIIVSWNDNSNNEKKFVIERSLTNTFATFTEIQVNANTMSISDRQNLNDETRYYYRIKATNNAGESSYSNIVDAVTLRQPSPPIGPFIADHTVINRLRLGNIPTSAIQNAKSFLHIGYGHTSHGSQITDGMSGLVAFANGSGLNGFYHDNENLFSWNRGGSDGALDLREGAGYGNSSLNLDCGYYPNWVDATRAYLNDPANYQVNVIIWSWCGQAAGYEEDDMNNRYLNPMNQLGNEYPDIMFIYMTCHLDGTGLSGQLHARNEQIRNYCIANDKWLFDFADIESFDPNAGRNYNESFADDNCDYDDDHALPREETDNWAINWQNTHTINVDWYECESAHSQPLNANMKAYAIWWLWCRIAGWNGI